MDNKKQNGSYYTSPLLANFLVKHIFEHYSLPNNLKILEPSCGNGIFIKALLKEAHLNPLCEWTLIEKDGLELEKTLDLVHSYEQDINVQSYKIDFLHFQKNIRNKYSLIVGNPPYIKKELLSKQQIKLCHEIHRNAGLSSNHIKNIWTSFLLASMMCLDENGVLCFILPAELLQVKYTKELREHLLDEFERIEIFAFNELIFENIQQDVVVLIGAKKNASNGKDGISFYQVDKLEDLKIPQYVEKSSNVHRKTLDKWTNYLLEDSELNFIEDLRSGLKPIKDYCDKINVGIVTAANSYFIVDNDTIDEYQLHDFSNNILSRASDIKKILDVTNDDIKNLKEANKKINFVNFPDVEISEIDQKAREYIKYGESLEIDKRYKCKLRENWYKVPSLWKCDGLFIKRAHKFPRVVINSADIYVTDSFYRINMKKEFDIKNLVFSFYNSLTLVLAELEGRYYGGGVLELTPNEFKKLSIPYCENISSKDISTLKNMFKNEQPISDILDYTDNILLKTNMRLEDQQISQLRSIREKLVARRLKL